ncbi:sensor histidine kinase [Microbacterium protaetiae]|uniref:histidine kinase n=1 Tax=Microbacterium protaetiae TaxID=2509458 RepID=A0A4P6EDH9_9MICO|nr:sensor histidine kinase [Microbacterium protaetiae]QAY60320.1 sensor histidine kinase [Microbacterium protaetiae]
MTLSDTAPARSATLERVRDSSRGTRYGRLWRRVPAELGFLLLGLPIAVAGFGATLALFVAGIGTLVTFFIGLFVLTAALYVSRAFGTSELVRLQWAGQPAITRPEWTPARPGFFGGVRSSLTNGHAWLYLLHTVLVNFVVSMITWVISVVWVAVGLGGVTYWFWSRFLPDRTDDSWYFSQSVLWLFGRESDAAGYIALDPLFYLAAGLIMLATLPLITRGLTLAHQGIAAAMLGAFASDALRRQVSDLNESRGAAIAAEGHALRRLERDIHDGPQQHLVRMQMDLASADRQLANDPEKTRTLIAEAMQQSRDALDELRALSRGFAPPILMDRGLVAALESAADRCVVRTRVVAELPPSIALPQEIERNAYFVASEALTNAAKHSGASEIEVRVAVSPRPGGDGSWLDVTVTDDGRGGATLRAGHGLVGLDERVRGAGGMLAVDSPRGGPTMVSARLPLSSVPVP